MLMRLVAISGSFTWLFIRCVTNANAARGHRGHDRRDARLVPADAGVDHGGAGGLDGLRQRDDLVPALAPFHQVEHRDPVDDDEARAKRRAHAAHDLDGEAHAVLGGAAPPVGAPVGARAQELVDEVALRAHDLDAVVACLERVLGAAHEVADLALDAALAERSWRERRDRRLELGRRDRERVVPVAPGVQDLHADAPALGAHRTRDLPVPGDLPGPGQLGGERRHPAGDVGRDPSGDDQADPAACALGEVGRERVVVRGAVLEPGVHGAHEHPVGQRHEAEVERGEQVRVGHRASVPGSGRAGNRRFRATAPGLLAKSASSSAGSPPMSHHDIRSAARPQPDQPMLDIADYVCDYEIDSSEAYRTARHCLLDSIACALMALDFPECVKLLGPIVPGATLPGWSEGSGHGLGARPGAGRVQHRLPGTLAGFQRHLARGRVGPSLDNLGALLGLGDYLARKAQREGRKPMTVRDLLACAIKAHEIQGVYALENSFNRVGLDHVLLVRLASTAIATRMLGGGQGRHRQRGIALVGGRRCAAHVPARAEHRAAQELGRGRRLPARGHARAQRHQGRDRLSLGA
jgi:hypothetical protein